MKIVTCKHSNKYKYCFLFEESEKMELYCKSINQKFGSIVIFFENNAWCFNDIKIVDHIKEAFPQVEIDENVLMDVELSKVVTSPFVLRDYQKEAVAKGVEHIKSKEKKGGVIVLPTGSGKSLVIASIAQQLPGKTLVLQPTKEILEQNLKKAKAFGFEDIGVFSASMGRKDIGKLTFATIGTIITKKELFVDFTNLLIDENHYVNSKGGQYEEFIKFFGGKCIGLTATPYRLHSYNDMKTGERAVVAKFLTRTNPRIFSTILHVTQIGELYNKGFLCPVKYEFNSNYNQGDIKLNSTGMDFDEKSLAEYNEKTGVVKIVSDNIKNNKSKHILVFSSSVIEAENLGVELKNNGINAVAISAKTPKTEREEILEKFRSGEIQVVTNVGVLTTGFDFPELDCIILARPTQSVSLFYQMIGRGIRIADNKQNVRVIDVCGNVAKFGKIESFEVVPTDTGVRLKSSAGYLTGVNFAEATKPDLEKTNYEGKVESQGHSSDIISFGRYKGTHIAKVPTGYLEWCIGSFGEGDAKRKFSAELLRRGK